jgi:hypothetical protein
MYGTAAMQNATTMHEECLWQATISEAWARPALCVLGR